MRAEKHALCSNLWIHKSEETKTKDKTEKCWIIATSYLMEHWKKSV